jgi:flavin-dependent dehydrogenase
VDGLYAPRRQVLDRVLVDAATAAGAEVRHRVAARDLWMAGGRVAGVVLDDGRTHTRVRAGLVLGADGIRSGVALRVGAQVRYAARGSSATVYTYATGLPAGAYRNYFRPGACAGVIPTNGGEANVWVGVPMERLRGAGSAGHARLFAHVLGRVAPELAEAVAGRRRYACFPGRPGFARQCFGPGWALVGDAGYFKDPASAHGMTDALIGAELLARAVLAAAGGEAEQVALAGYARQRWRLIAPMIPAVAHVASYRWDAASLQRAHRAMGAAMRAEWESTVPRKVSENSHATRPSGSSTEAVLCPPTADPDR